MWIGSSPTSGLFSVDRFVLCEWLDMPPINTAVTNIEEVFVLRLARRLSSNKRSGFSDPDVRKQQRSQYVQHLDDHPFSTVPFQRFLDHIGRLLGPEHQVEEDVLKRGYF